VQGEIPHAQYLAFLQMRAQANYRKEVFELTFEDFQTLWQENWYRKGRASEDYCLTREDPDGPWNRENAICIQRIDHLRRQRQFKTGRF
jgi:hypothetical protein